MIDDAGFRDLIGRVRAGDAEAAAELVRRYEPAIRLAVHVRLTDPALRRLFDSMDICQSVLGSFFPRAAGGQYELDSPTQLLKLLTTMARNKLLTHVQAQRSARRDYRRVVEGLADEQPGLARGPEPSQVAANRELLVQLRSRLSDDERLLADRRAAGCSWKEIAAETGGQPNTLRMQLTRALDRVLKELGLESRL